MMKYLPLFVLLLMACTPSAPALLSLQLWGEWIDSTGQYQVQFTPETKDTAWVQLPGDSAVWHIWRIEERRVNIGPHPAHWEADSPFARLWLPSLGLRLHHLPGPELGDLF